MAEERNVEERNAEERNAEERNAGDGAAGGSEPRRSELYRRLPSVDRVLESADLGEWMEETATGREVVRRGVNEVLESLRDEIGAGRLDEQRLEERLEGLVGRVARWVEERCRPRLRPVINATGVVVHTNLGRSPWSDAAAERVARLSRRYLNLEYDLEEGERGHRDRPVESLLSRLLPGVAAAVVNNNAAAVLLVLNTLADGREVLVSRGQLVEIGGSFRIPDVMERGGAILREVGTTNRTRIEDFDAAVGPDTALLLAVHPSNFRVVGFTESVELAELVDLGRRRGLPVVEDMGSGNLVDLEPLGVAGEPTVARRLETGVDLLTFSGDKLLGGPQAGFVVGEPELVGRVRANPLYRAVRVDKSIALAIEATLAAFLAGRTGEIPTLAMVARTGEELREAAVGLVERLEGSSVPEAASFEVVETSSRIGGGAAPDVELPSWGVAVDGGELEAGELAARLRAGEPAVVGRIVDDRLVLDLRTLLPGEAGELVDAILAAIR